MRSHFPSVATVAAFIAATIFPSGCNSSESVEGHQSDAGVSGGAHAMTAGAAGTSGSSSGGGSAAGTGGGGASGSVAGGTANAAGGANESGGAAPNGGTTSGGAPAAGGASSGGASMTGGAPSGVPGSTLPSSWNASPPAGVSPAPSGPVVGNAGEFDTGTLAANEIWDNFDGAAASKPDSRLWVLDTTNQGGTQVYDPARTFLDGTGNVVLEAIQSGSTVYSGRFTSRTKFNMRYGWCAARIKFPKAGQSWFPAFWLLHQGYNTNPNYGEIDVMEFFGNTKNYSTHIYITNSTLESTKPVPANQSGGNAGDGYHTYWMQWESNRVRIGVDDLLMGDWGPTSVPAGTWDLAITQPYYFIANFAVHPSWLPAPLATDFPARMLIDWIWYKPL